ncbi:MAG: hypothetical protein MI975_01410 [Cytophagales bacterium]|nr:hypothetical protein [Cytophagales bacterium]
MKNGNYRLIIIVPLIFIGAIRCTYYTNPVEDIVIPPPPLAYVGSEACKSCHEGIYETFKKSGHPYVHAKVEDGKPPEYPFTSIDFVPPHFSNKWDDITYVIGGFAWKYHFTDNDGYIYTGEDAQYNFQNQSAVSFHADEAPGTKKFTCGRCHTTGWKSIEDGGAPKDDLPGMGGDYFTGGVQCEACHGMGSVHAFTRSPDDIESVSDATLCGQCHYRNEDHSIAAANGFIKHNTQFDELQSAGHKTLACVSCHNPHASVQHGQTEGIIKECTECHDDLKNPTHRGADCVTCHMPNATKSAVVTNKYVADISTHIFKINPDEDGEMFNEDGTIAKGETGVTLGYVCYQCHKDSEGVGGDKSTKTLKQLSDLAKDFHE